MNTKLVAELSQISENQKLLFEKADPARYEIKKAPGKWSKKEIVGHLIDSAQNNIQRFIRARYESDPSIIYNQDQWVSLNNYQNSDFKELIDLWYLLNKRILVIIKNIPENDLSRKCRIKDQSYSIEWIFEDYIRHLKHHLNQINEE